MKITRLMMGGYWARKYLTGDILTFIFGVFLVTELAINIMEHIRHNRAVNRGTIKALQDDLKDVTFSIYDLYNIRYEMIDFNGVKCRPNVKYAVILLTEADNIEYRQSMRSMWTDFRYIIDATTENSSKVVLPRHQMFFLIHSLEGQTPEALRNLINESFTYGDVFYVQNIYNASSLRNETYDFSYTIRGLMFASAVCQNVSHIIISEDNTFIHIKNAISHMDHKGMPWSVHGWFYSDIRGNDADTFIDVDTRALILSADLTSSLLDLSMDDLSKAENSSILFDLLLRLRARIIPDNGFLTGKWGMREPLTSICDYVPNQIISRANMILSDMRKVWFILRQPFPHCKAALKRLAFWNYFKVREKEVWTFNKTILIENLDLCSSSPDVVIMIHSYAMDFQNRSITRMTWASPAHNVSLPIGDYTMKTKLVFVLGSIDNSTIQKQILEESKQFRDILQGSFKEEYQHLPMKHTLGFSWIGSHCDNAKYVLKADDDVIVNLPYLQTVLKVAPLRRSIVGSVRSCPWRAPVRNTEDKWGVTPDTYSLIHYPIYVPGSSYLVTMDIVAELASTSERMRYLPFDDVFFTGILARTIGVNHIYWPKYRNKYAYSSLEQPTGSIACSLQANHWIDTFFWGKNRALAVWKRLEKNNLSCIWPQDSGASSSLVTSNSDLETFLGLVFKIFCMLSVTTLLVCCKTGFCA